MPEPRAPRQNRTAGQRAAGRARQIGRAATRFDVDLGPFEVALGTFAAIVAGSAVGLIPVVLFRSVILLIVGPLLGAVGGWGVAHILRSRITVRGWRLGMVGVLLLALLFFCGSCAAAQGIAQLQNLSKAQKLRENAEAMGLPVPKAAPGMQGTPNLQMGPQWWILPLLLAIAVVVCLTIGAILVILNRRTAQPGP